MSEQASYQPEELQEAGSPQKATKHITNRSHEGTVERYMREIREESDIDPDRVHLLAREAYIQKFQMLNVLSLFPPILESFISLCNESKTTRFNTLRQYIDEIARQDVRCRDDLYELNGSLGNERADGDVKEVPSIHQAVYQLEKAYKNLSHNPDASILALEDPVRLAVSREYMLIVLTFAEFDRQSKLFMELTSPIVETCEKLYESSRSDINSVWWLIGTVSRSTLDEKVASVVPVGSRTEVKRRLSAAIRLCEQYGMTLESVFRLGARFQDAAEKHRRAVNELSRINLLLAAKLTYANRFHENKFFDALQSANEGLLYAAEKFVYWKRFRFSTYATFWIKQSIRKYKAKEANGVVTLTLGVINLRNKINEHEKHSPCSASELARSLNKSVQQIDIARSMYTPLSEIDDDTLGYESSPESDVTSENTEHVVRLAIESLSCATKRRIFKMRFGIGCDAHTLEEIAERESVSYQRVKNVVVEAMDEIRQGPHIEVLSDLYSS